ncbi:MAG: hypothetical protein M0P13_12515 [Fibrobacteraceae bacterium]|nr:hypothetical protein [Fibrobacteraceae bacterium]
MRLHDPSGNAGAPPECTDQIDYNLPNQDVKALPDNPTLGGMRGNASGNFKLHLEPELGNDASSLVLLDDCKFNCGKSYTEAVKDLTVIVKAIGQQDLTDQQKNEIAKIPEPQNFLLLAKDAYTKGKAYLSDPKNRAQVEGFDQLRTETMGDSGKNEFYITGHTGKIKNLNPKIGVISNEGQKSVIPKYDPKDTVIFHSHPDENPLSFNGRYIKDSRGEYVEGRGGDLLASASSDKGVFAITPSGDIYFTTPKLAYFGITHSSLGLTPSSDGSGKFGQVYLGNIRDYRRDK